MSNLNKRPYAISYTITSSPDYTFPLGIEDSECQCQCEWQCGSRVSNARDAWICRNTITNRKKLRQHVFSTPWYACHLHINWKVDQVYNVDLFLLKSIHFKVYFIALWNLHFAVWKYIIMNYISPFEILFFILNICRQLKYISPFEIYLPISKYNTILNIFLYLK